MNNEYQNIIVTAKEDMSWSEANWCWEYANQVVDYCNEDGIDLADASNAESAIVQYNEEQRSFCDQYGYELSDYLGTIVANVGMIVEG